MAFETKILDLSGGPVDLLADTDIAAEIAGAGGGGALIFMQNIGEGDVHYSEQPTEPALSDRGHLLLRGDGAGLVLDDSEPDAAWVWAPSGAGYVAVSPAKSD